MDIRCIYEIFGGWNMHIYKVTFAGHRELDNVRGLEEGLSILIREIITNHEFVEFYVGDSGEFDILATSVIRRTRRAVGSERCAISLILPYKRANIDIITPQFDSVIVPPCAEKAYPKSAIFEKNKWMVEQSDMIICYVKRQGGAKRMLEYAEKKAHIKIINLADG